MTSLRTQMPLKAGVGNIVLLSFVLLNIVCLYKYNRFYFAVHISKLNNQVIFINTFTAKYLKKPIPQCHAFFQGLLNIEGLWVQHTEYLQNHSTYRCETFTECC